MVNVMDDVTLDCLATTPDTSIPSCRVARELMAFEFRGRPGIIVSDKVLPNDRL